MRHISNTPATYEKRPVRIQAWQWDGTRAGALAIKSWANDEHGTLFNFLGSDEQNYFAVFTLEGMMQITADDYVIRGLAGEYYPCKPEIFAASYIEVSE